MKETLAKAAVIVGRKNDMINRFGTEAQFLNLAAKAVSGFTSEEQDKVNSILEKLSIDELRIVCVYNFHMLRDVLALHSVAKDDIELVDIMLDKFLDPYLS